MLFRSRAGPAFSAAPAAAPGAVGRRNAARLRSARGGPASAWLGAVGAAATTRLGDDAFRLAGRLRAGLGSALAFAVPPCRCRNGNSALPDHPLICQRLAKLIQLRHDILVSTWRLIISKAGCSSSAEPRYAALRAAGGAAPGAKRGDLVASLPGGRVIVGDVVVAHPLAPSHLRAAAERSGATAATAADGKRERLGAVCEGAGYEFVPLAHESYGRLGRGALSLVSTLGDIAAAGGRVSKAAFVSAALRELSCSLCRLNARVFQAGVDDSLNRTTGRQHTPGAPVAVAEAGHVW